MKKIIILLIILLFPLLSLLPVAVFAQTNFRSNESPSLAKNEVINDNYFSAGEKVTVSGIVNGDAFIAGGEVLIDGEINGDLLVAGGNVTIRGRVINDLRVAGGNLTISGPIEGNVTIVGGDIFLTDNARIGGSLVAVGGNFQVFSPIGKSATFAAGNVVIGNSIGGDIVAGVGKLDLVQSASVAGNINYWSSEKIDVSPNASVSGSITLHQTPQNKQKESEAKVALAGLTFFWKLVSFTSALILGLLFIKFFPVFSKGVSTTLQTSTLKSLFIGLIALVVTPVGVVLLLITIFGIPIAAIILIVYLIEIYLTKIFVSLALGEYLAKRFKWKISIGWIYLLGLVIFFILSSIPVLGALISLSGLLLGLGAILIYKQKYYFLAASKKIV